MGQNMNRLLFEGRTLAGIVSSIIRQNDPHIAFKRLDWERMFRLADYHKVANVVYLGVLGHRDEIPEKWHSRFFERYQESLQFGEHCKESIKEVLTWLDMREVSCTILASEFVRDYYQIAEAAENSPVQILLDEENYFLAKGYLIDLGYEIDAKYKGAGEQMNKVSSISVILYKSFPFRTGRYEKNMTRLLETAFIKEPYENIMMLPPESEFIYRMAGAAYRYVVDELTLREVLDLFLCHKAWRNRINMEAVWKRLDDFQIGGLAENILRIAYMWFSDKKDNYFADKPVEDMAVYDVLEERLLTKGILNHENDIEAIRLQKLIQKEIDKEKKKEGREILGEKIGEYFRGVRKRLRWAFPDYHYMSSIYPIVEKIPILLPVFWVVRGVRILVS